MVFGHRPHLPHRSFVRTFVICYLSIQRCVPFRPQFGCCAWCSWANCTESTGNKKKDMKGLNSTMDKVLPPCDSNGSANMIRVSNRLTALIASTVLILRSTPSASTRETRRQIVRSFRPHFHDYHIIINGSRPNARSHVRFAPIRTNTLNLRSHSLLRTPRAV